VGEIPYGDPMIVKGPGSDYARFRKASC
jgi:hypothetical protein